MADPKCRRCSLNLVKCKHCKGRGDTQMTTCGKCDHTGWICPSHGGYWQ